MSRQQGRPGHARQTGVWLAVKVLAAAFVVLLAVTVTLLVTRDRQQQAGAGPSPGSAATSDGSSDGSSDEGGSPSPGPDDVVLDADADLTLLESPSGNITCLIGPGDAGAQDSFAECSISEVTWSIPAPDDCDLDWGGGGDGPGRVSIAADGDEAEVVCADEALEGSQPPKIVPYGEAVWLDDELVCRSEETGMTCESLGSRRGFTVSRAELDLF